MITINPRYDRTIAYINGHVDSTIQRGSYCGIPEKVLETLAANLLTMTHGRNETINRIPFPLAEEEQDALASIADAGWVAKSMIIEITPGPREFRFGKNTLAHVEHLSPVLATCVNRAILVFLEAAHNAAFRPPSDLRNPDEVRIITLALASIFVTELFRQIDAINTPLNAAAITAAFRAVDRYQPALRGVVATTRDNGAVVLSIDHRAIAIDHGKPEPVSKSDVFTTNLNDKIRFNLTERGIAFLEGSLFRSSATFDGTTWEMQLYVFAHVFGPVLTMGKATLVESNEVWFEVQR